MADGAIRLSGQELRLLRALAEGRQVHMVSAHRLRFEMLGLVRDGSRGLTLTPLGLRRSREPASDDEPVLPAASTPRDRLGRRKANRRLSPF